MRERNDMVIVILHAKVSPRINIFVIGIIYARESTQMMINSFCSTGTSNDDCPVDLCYFVAQTIGDYLIVMDFLFGIICRRIRRGDL